MTPPPTPLGGSRGIDGYRRYRHVSLRTTAILEARGLTLQLWPLPGVRPFLREETASVRRCGSFAAELGEVLPTQLANATSATPPSPHVVVPAVVRRSESRAETLLRDLLRSQGWGDRRPPRGQLYVQHEYLDDRNLADALAHASKAGDGPGIPEAILVDQESGEPLAVVETKAAVTAIDIAVDEAESYGSALVQAGYSPAAIGLAGTDEEEFALQVSKWTGRSWAPITYDGNPITWIPGAADLRRVTLVNGPTEIRPSPPPIEVLAARADEINRLLREADIKDEYRPAHVAAVMLSLWYTGGNIRRSPKYVVQDVNAGCQEAFMKAGKPRLGRSLQLDKANDKLSSRVPRIVKILERLNVTVLTAEHDYLGQLYETFFRYTGGNTIGQYFTPRHIARMMVDLCAATSRDTVLDVACGTGGFFVAFMGRLVEEEHLRREETVRVFRDSIVGFESEPATAALCVANMILRGDGSTRNPPSRLLGGFWLSRW